MDRYTKYGNVMINLETLSTHANAAIIEIGAVEFNKYTGDIGERLNIIINPSDWCKNERHVDGNTVQWWLKQSKQAIERFTTQQKDIEYLNLDKALEQLKYFINDCGNYDEEQSVVVWVNGSTMDITILQSAYEHFNMKLPWKYWSVNDVRTIVGLNPLIKENCKFTEGIKHSAVSDCLHQIKYLTDAIKTLTVINNE